jgi:uncharacterized protein YegP (UPF0339 family)
MAGKFTVFIAKNGETYFNLKAGNGEIILRSQGYKDKAGALNGIASVRKHASDAANFEKGTSSNGKAHFSLKAANHQIIGNSQMYESASSCDGGIASVMAHAAEAELVEE